jgi:sensor histidine kinase YesM
MLILKSDKKMNSVTDKIKAAQNRAILNEIGYKQQIKEYWEEHSKLEFEIKTKVYPNVSPATNDDYSTWLYGFIYKNNANITYSDKNFSSRDFYVATKDLFIPELYGAQSIKIIIPEGKNVEYEKLGHNSLYLMKGFCLINDCSATVYNDFIYQCR